MLDLAEERTLVAHHSLNSMQQALLPTVGRSMVKAPDDARNCPATRDTMNKVPIAPLP